MAVKKHFSSCSPVTKIKCWYCSFLQTSDMSIADFVYLISTFLQNVSYHVQITCTRADFHVRGRSTWYNVSWNHCILSMRHFPARGNTKQVFSASSRDNLQPRTVYFSQDNFIEQAQVSAPNKSIIITSQMSNAIILVVCSVVCRQHLSLRWGGSVNDYLKSRKLRFWFLRFQISNFTETVKILRYAHCLFLCEGYMQRLTPPSNLFGI